MCDYSLRPFFGPALVWYMTTHTWQSTDFMNSVSNDTLPFSTMIIVPGPVLSYFMHLLLPLSLSLSHFSFRSRRCWLYCDMHCGLFTPDRVSNHCNSTRATQRSNITYLIHMKVNLDWVLFFTSLRNIMCISRGATAASNCSTAKFLCVCYQKLGRLST